MGLFIKGLFTGPVSRVSAFGNGNAAPKSRIGGQNGKKERVLKQLQRALWSSLSRMQIGLVYRCRVQIYPKWACQR